MNDPQIVSATSADPSPSKGSKWRRHRKKWYRKLGVWLIGVTAVVVLFAGLGIFVGPKIKHFHARWSGHRAVQRAAQCLAKGDVEGVVLNARRALTLDPQNAEAHRVVAQALEAAGAPAALEWRRKLDSIRPGDAENLIALTKDSLAAGFRDAAADALGRVKPQDRNSAAYHDMAARIAIGQKDMAAAKSHWEEAAKLDPKEPRYKMNLAVLQTKSGDAAARAKALDELRDLGAKPESSRVAQRALLSDALAEGDAIRAKEAVTALASAPDAAFQDKLSRLSTLRSINDPESTRLLIELRDGATAKPEELFQLLSWMDSNHLSLTVLSWLPELPPEIIAKPPVCIAIANARVEAMDWEKLKASVESGSWGPSDFARLSFKARALERLGHPAESEEAWQGALLATEGSPQRLEELAKTALGWRWEERGAAALWKLTATGSTPSWALGALWNAAMKRGDTEQLRKVSKLQMKADPQSIGARNNFILLSLLTHSKEEGIHKLAETLFKEAPTQPDVVSTYALSLSQQNKSMEALAAMNTLKPEQLREPSVARYYAIILTDAGRGSEAGEYLTLGEQGTLLPEEKVLIANAQQFLGTKAKTQQTSAAVGGF